MSAPAPIGRAQVEQVAHEVIRMILPTLAPAAITGDKHLKDLGADSIDRIEIILAVTERLAITEPMSNFSDLPNIAALVDHLYRARPA